MEHERPPIGIITGTTTFKWLQKEDDDVLGFSCSCMDTDYAGKPIKSHKLIGYNPKTKAFFSYVYSNNAPDPYETISTIHNARKSQVASQLRKGGSLVVIKKKGNCKIYHF